MNYCKCWLTLILTEECGFTWTFVLGLTRKVDSQSWAFSRKLKLGRCSFRRASSEWEEGLSLNTIVHKQTIETWIRIGISSGTFCFSYLKSSAQVCANTWSRTCTGTRRTFENDYFRSQHTDRNRIHHASMTSATFHHWCTPCSTNRKAWIKILLITRHVLD